MTTFKDKFSFVKARTSSQPFARSEAPYPRASQISSITKTLLRVVRLTGILILFACLHVSAGITAQERISINMKSAPLEKVFAEIELRSGYTVFYNTEVLKYSGLVTVEMKDAMISDVMRQVLKGLPLEFNIQDRTIFVKHVSHGTAADPGGPGGPRKEGPTPEAVSGVVQTEAGLPLVGATVYMPKLRKSGMTNAKGEFTIPGLPDGEYEVEISYVGYEPLKTRITVANHTGNLTAALKQSTSKLDESVVIAYGVTSERLNTGNVAKVSSKEIEEQPVGNPLEALEGRVPGLLITQTTGLPGGAFNVQIRGQNSIANGNAPFYVIDGVPYNSQLAAAPLNGYLYGGSPLNFINPYDIESIEILKDADATAIYGSRAANGAILITTKKGQVGTMKFDVNIKSGFTNPAHTIPVLNTSQYLAMRHEAFVNDGKKPKAGDHDVNGDWDTTRNDNWPKALASKQAQYTDAEASVSGGNTNIQYYIGGGYNIQRTGFPTLLPGDGGDRRGSIHFNLTSFSADKRFKLNLTGSYVADKNTVQSQDFTNTALYMVPDAPAIFNPDGSLNWAPLAPGQRGTWQNPYGQLYIKYVGNNSNLVGNGILSYELLKGLELKASFGYTNTRADESHTQPTTAFDPNSGVTSGSSVFNTTNSFSWIIEPQVDYRLALGKGSLTALVGSSFLEKSMNAVSTSASGFISDALLTDMQAASTVNVGSNSSQYKYEAIFGRLGYNWMDKYLLNVTARRDGSSRFGSGKQFGNFGAVGAGWIFSKEEFFQKNVGFLSFGKLRASYGTTGNDQIGDYQFVDTYGPTNRYSYGGYQGLSPNNLANPLLAWETTKKLEAGVELGFLKDRVVVQASYYRNRSGNELVQTPTSAVTGFSLIPFNLPALVQNSGEEFVLNTTNIRTKNFTWTSSFNLTIGRNTLLSYPNLASSPYVNKLIVGQPINILKVYHCIGVNDTTGVYQFASPKVGPTYNPSSLTDLTGLVNINPKYYGGFRNSFSYKGFSLDIFFQFVEQTGLKLWASLGNQVIPGTMFNEPTGVLNRWQQPGDRKPYEKFTENYGSKAAAAFSYAQVSDFAYGDASFIRLKNMALSWQMPQTLVRGMKLSNLRVYLQGQNLLTMTKYDGLDPESRSATTGPRRAYTAGLQVEW